MAESVDPTAVMAVRSDLENRIALTLHRCRELHAESSRRLLLSQVERHSGVPVPVAEYPSIRQWFIAFVEACGNGSAGIQIIVLAIRTFGLDPDVIGAISRLRDEWEAVPVALDAGEPLWARLRDELQRVTRAAAVVAFQKAHERWPPLPPAHCENGWDVLLHLSGRNAAPDGLPAYIPYLECVLDQLSPKTVVLAEQWNQRRAYELSLTGRLNELRLRRIPRDAPKRRTLHLIFQFERDGSRTSKCYLSWWRQWDEQSPSFECGARLQPARLDDVEKLTEKIVTDTEVLLSERDDDIVLEFTLPIDLMNVAVERWRKESDSILPKPLGSDYPVVLRSLERQRNPHWQRMWRQRWRHLHEAPHSAGTYQSRPGDGGDQLARLEAQLLANPNLVAAVLSGAPTAEVAALELEIVLRCGLPVVLWHRAEAASRAASDAVKSFVDGGRLADLPERARALRLQARGFAGPEGHSHLGQHLAILWDDPDRRPERGRPDSLSSGGEMRQ
jgi:vWA-MoxR associated protein C-terminal domain/vWA-MoxR associated protein middle region 0/Effector-associated domain 2